MTDAQFEALREHRDLMYWRWLEALACCSVAELPAEVRTALQGTTPLPEYMTEAFPEGVS